MTVAEASEFWDSHSVADYPSHVVDIEYAPEQSLNFVAISTDLLPLVERQARERGVSVETLLNLWVREKVTA
jgi:hypothetical protein